MLGLGLSLGLMRIGGGTPTPSPTPADYTATSEAELDTIIGYGAATLNGKRIALSSRDWAQRTITLAPATSATFEAQNAASRPNLIKWKIGAGAANLFFEDLRFVTDSWGTTSLNDVLAYNGTGSVGACTFTRCGFKGGYGGPGTTGSLWTNDIDPTGTTRYPEYANIIPQFNDTGAVTSFIVKRDNVAGLLADGTHNMVFSDTTGITFTTSPTGTFTVSGGLITGTTLTGGGASNATTANNNSIGVLSKIISWTGQNKMASYLKFGVGRDASSVSVTGLQKFVGCDFADLSNAIKFTPPGGVWVENCTFDRIYQDTLAFGIASDGDTGGEITVIDNLFTRGFSAQGDAGDPHADQILQLYMDDQGATQSSVDWGPITIERNICFDGNSRGHGQGILLADTPDGIYYKDVRIVGNIHLSRLSTIGFQSEGIRNGYLYRNTQVRYLYDHADNAGVIVKSAISGPAAAVNPAVGEQALWQDNIFESMNSNTGASTSVGNILLGTAGATLAYSTVFATPPTNAAGSGTWPTTKAAVLAAFAPTAGYAGKGAAGSDGYLDYTNRTTDVSMEPVWCDFTDLSDQVASSAVSSAWRKILGGAASGTYAVTGGTAQFADDVNGTNATVASTSGNYTRGKYVRLNLTNSASGSTATTATITFNGTWPISFASVTASSSQYPRVLLDLATPDLFRRSSGSLGTDGALGTLALRDFKMAAPPTASETIWGSSSGTARVKLDVLTTGKLRLWIHNGSSYAWRIETNTNVCDGAYHNVLFSWDVSQVSQSDGRQVYLDGSANSNGSATWGSPGTVQYSTSINAYQFGPNGGSQDFEIGAFYLNVAARVDLADANNRAKFNPDLIGTNGTGPTGTSPIIFLVGNAAQWNDAAGVNFGSGAKYIKVGTAAAADVSGSAWS